MYGESDIYSKLKEKNVKDKCPLKIFRNFGEKKNKLFLIG